MIADPLIARSLDARWLVMTAGTRRDPAAARTASRLPIARQPDPVGTDPCPGSPADPGGSTRVQDRQPVRRGTRGRAGRRRRGAPARLARRRGLRPAARARATPDVGSFRDLRRRARPHPGGPCPRRARDERPRRVHAPNRGARAADDPGGQPAPAAAARAPARADVAAARGPRASRADDRDRRLRLARPLRGESRLRVRLAGHRDAPPAGRVEALDPRATPAPTRATSSRSSRAWIGWSVRIGSTSCSRSPTSWSSRRR